MWNRDDRAHYNVPSYRARVPCESTVALIVGKRMALLTRLRYNSTSFDVGEKYTTSPILSL